MSPYHSEKLCLSKKGSIWLKLSVNLEMLMLLLLSLMVNQGLSSAVCPEKVTRMQAEEYLRCWEEEADADTGIDYCQALIEGENKCRTLAMAQTCEEKIIGILLMIKRGRQSRELMNLGWGSICPMLNLWHVEEERYMMKLARNNNRKIKIFVNSSRNSS